MKNLDLASALLQELLNRGVSEFVLCAGARNAPLVTVLSRNPQVKTYSFFEERSAGFFALGRMQATARPVAVVTTSGTAAANLLPAAIESDYQGLPLVLLTADRPRRYRGSGAPQTIVQPGLFSHYVETSWDIEGEFAPEPAWSGRRPVHVNVCFDEPILEGEAAELRVGATFEPESAAGEFSARPDLSALALAESPLVIVGGLPLSETKWVHALLNEWKFPVYAEAPSQLRGQLGESEILESEIANVPHDTVIRIGSVPTLRYWRDLENSRVPVLHFSHLPFSGLPRSREVLPLQALLDCKFSAKEGTRMSHAQARLDDRLRRFPFSEPAWVAWLSRQIPEGARVFLGNSLPIREWDLAADRERTYEIFVNRGVNGIDGLLSTFLGAADAKKSNWCILGDLSALYDLSGPWALRARPELKDVNFVIINNGGGKIFQRIFNNALFENRHDVQFADWAKMWNLGYVKLQTTQELPKAKGPRVIEIIPDGEQTQAFYKERT